MHVLDTTGPSVRQGKPVRMILLSKVWFVVAQGYLC